MGIPFTRLAKLKAGETVVFSWILYQSRAHHDRVNMKVMAYGKFKTLVKA